MSKFNSNYVPRSALTIFAHPDDAEFGVAGTLAKWARAGSDITMVLCTSGNVGTHDASYTPKTLAETRENEQREAAGCMGVQRVVFLRHDDCALQPTLELRRELVREIRMHQPEVVICGDPTGWFYGNGYINHPDHRAAAEAALEAVFPCAEMELLWPELGPAHKVHAVYIAMTDTGDVAIDIGDMREAKVQTLKMHKSQMGEWDPTEMVTQWAKSSAKEFRKKQKKDKKARGKLKYAEVFRVMVLQDEEQPPES